MVTQGHNVTGEFSCKVSTWSSYHLKAKCFFSWHSCISEHRQKCLSISNIYQNCSIFIKLIMDLLIGILFYININWWWCAVLNLDFFFWINCLVYLLQVYHDTSEGKKVCTYYKTGSVPVVLVIDPITGQKMRSWSGMVHPDRLLEVNFYCSNFQGKFKEYYLITYFCHEWIGLALLYQSFNVNFPPLCPNKKIGGSGFVTIYG